MWPVGTAWAVWPATFLFGAPLLLLTFSSRVKLPRWALGVMALHGYLAASIAWSADPEYGWTIFGMTLYTPALLCLAIQVRPLPRLLLLLLAVAGVVFALVGLVSGENGSRLSAFGGGPIVFARVVAMSLLVFVYYYARTGKWLLLLPIPLLVMVEVLSGSRGPWLSTAIAGGSLIVMLYTRISSPRQKIACLGVAGLLGLALATGWAPDTVYGRVTRATINEHYDTGRLTMTKWAWEGFLKHPLIGMGLGGYSSITQVIPSRYGAQYSDKPTYPHNLLLDVAATGGVVGLGLLAGTLVLYWRALRSRRMTPLSYLFASLGILQAVGSMTSGTFYDARWIWLFMLLVMVTTEQKTLPAPSGGHSITA